MLHLEYRLAHAHINLLRSITLTPNGTQAQQCFTRSCSSQGNNRSPGNSDANSASKPSQPKNGERVPSTPPVDPTPPNSGPKSPIKSESGTNNSPRPSQQPPSSTNTPASPSAPSPPPFPPAQAPGPASAPKSPPHASTPTPETKPNTTPIGDTVQQLGTLFSQQAAKLLDQTRQGVTSMRDVINTTVAETNWLKELKERSTSSTSTSAPSFISKASAYTKACSSTSSAASDVTTEGGSSVYDEKLKAQGTLQRDMNSLLQRKSSWTETDVTNFTNMYRSEHALDAAVAAARENLEVVSDAKEGAQADLMRAIRERYAEEQMWSDKIRQASTWWTWVMMGVQGMSFLALYSILEPRKARLLRGHVQRVVKENGEVDIVYLPGVQRVVKENGEVNVVYIPGDGSLPSIGGGGAAPFRMTNVEEAAEDIPHNYAASGSGPGISSQFVEQQVGMARVLAISLLSSPNRERWEAGGEVAPMRRTNVGAGGQGAEAAPHNYAASAGDHGLSYLVVEQMSDALLSLAKAMVRLQGDVELVREEVRYTRGVVHEETRKLQEVIQEASSEGGLSLASSGASVATSAGGLEGAEGRARGGAARHGVPTASSSPSPPLSGAARESGQERQGGGGALGGNKDYFVTWKQATSVTAGAAVAGAVVASLLISLLGCDFFSASDHF
eukprot:gene10115-8016_t